MGGHQVPSQGPGDDGFDEEGYDESQRAEILEVTRDGPSDGVLLTDIEPDLGDDSVEDEPIDELDMDSEEVGETDASVDMAEEDLDEDDLQEDFEQDRVADGDIDDADDTALRP
ncbi:MAG: DNA primase [Sphingomonas pseudosanguinis]|uniref:DNA primase n=1 Tax=Sphingomonas pseudosanguinis TaxID=413712 RepID=UPI00391B9952